MYLCAADGSFLGFGPSCELADCSLSLASRSTDVSRNFSNCVGIRAGSACTVPCADGHQGQESLYRCLPDGSLQSFESQCVRKRCGIPDTWKDQSFGSNCFGTRHGETCIAECSEGFFGLSERLRCEDGTLQGARPQCTAFECSLEGVRLEPGMDASDCVGKKTLETCSLQCRRGYFSTGSPEMTCQASGGFTAHAFNCFPKPCGDLAAVAGFSAPAESSCAGLSFGEVCWASCQLGWQLQGNATILVCDDAPSSSSGFSVFQGGSYLPAVEAGGPSCKAQACTANLPNLRGVSHDCAGKVTNESCTVRASPGYRFQAVDGQLPETVALLCRAEGSFAGEVPPVVAERCPEVSFGPGIGSTCVNTAIDFECWAYCEQAWFGTPRRYVCRMNAITDSLELQAVGEGINCTADVRRLDASDDGTCSDDATLLALQLGSKCFFCPRPMHMCDVNAT